MSFSGEAWIEPWELRDVGALLEWMDNERRPNPLVRSVFEFVWSLTDQPQPSGSLQNMSTQPPVLSMFVPGTSTQVVWTFVNTGAEKSVVLLFLRDLEV